MRLMPRQSLRLPVLIVLTAALALAASAAAAGGPSIPTGGFLDPHDPHFEGPSYMSLTVTGQQTRRVRVRAHGASAFGRLAPHSSNTIRRGRVWDFGHRRRDRTPRMKALLDKVFAEYDRSGVAVVRVRVYSGADRLTDWACTLTERTADSSCAPRG